eukprot:COSAG01_NODE_547_length_15635_cov_102.896498_6_plen_75_part_00
MRNLSNLNIGEHCIIHDVSVDLADKLLAYGLFTGTRVTLLHRMPFKGPLIIKVRDISLSLRYTHAEKIKVKAHA